MRFVSKNLRYSVTLKNSQSGNPTAGIPMIAGVRMMFNDGIADIDDESVIKLARANRSFNREYFEDGTEEAKANFNRGKAFSEPRHQNVSTNPAASANEEVVKDLTGKVDMLSKRLEEALNVITNLTAPKASPEAKPEPETKPEPEPNEEAKDQGNKTKKS